MFVEIALKLKFFFTKYMLLQVMCENACFPKPLPTLVITVLCKYCKLKNNISLLFLLCIFLIPVAIVYHRFSFHLCHFYCSFLLSIFYDTVQCFLWVLRALSIKIETLYYTFIFKVMFCSLLTNFVS